MKKLLPLLLLTACAKEDPSFQENNHTSFTEIVSKVKNRINEPQLQWFSFDGKMKAYINVFVGELKAKLASHREIKVNIETDRGKLSFKAPLRKGDQKLAIPDKMMPRLQSLLERSKTATLSLGHYKTKLNLKQFKEMLNKNQSQESSTKLTLFDL